MWNLGLRERYIEVEGGREGEEVLGEREGGVDSVLMEGMIILAWLLLIAIRRIKKEVEVKC